MENFPSKYPLKFRNILCSDYNKNSLVFHYKHARWSQRLLITFVFSIVYQRWSDSRAGSKEQLLRFSLPADRDSGQVRVDPRVRSPESELFESPTMYDRFSREREAKWPRRLPSRRRLTPISDAARCVALQCV